jgi:uncharacterized protein
MRQASRGFQIFAKPAGAACNLACRYCYYLGKATPGGESRLSRMPDDVLEDYIAQHLQASPDEVIRFSWHGGEPTVLGLDYFRRIVDFQRRHRPAGWMIANGMQTNGTLLDEEWCAFLAAEGFSVGLSLDGPRELNDRHRLTRDQESTFDRSMRGYDLLRRHGVPTDILCVVSAENARHPLEAYRFFKRIGAGYVTFLPLVEPCPDAEGGVSPETVSAEAWGDFLCQVFDEWVRGDIGRIKVQIIEEAARTAFDQEHSLCIFRPECGDIRVLERNGDLYACDHFVDPEHRLGNITRTPLVDLLDSPALRDFGQDKRRRLPRVCQECGVRDMCNGECPKNRLLRAPDGGPGLNYLCAGYRRFFERVRPFVAEVAAEWRRQNPGRTDRAG